MTGGNMITHWKNPVAAIPNKMEQGDGMAMKIVAVVHDGTRWSAYRGPSNWSDERVAQQGDKIPKEAAELLFYACRNAPHLSYYG
jgi:hypothetical protein